jgi:hypothetical protein
MGGDNVNLRSAGIRKAGVNATSDQRANQTFGSIHLSAALSFRWFGMVLEKDVILFDFQPARAREV